MKKLFVILSAALCLAACGKADRGYMFDKLYEDPTLFGIQMVLDAPSDITESGAVITFSITDRESAIVSYGVVVGEESYSQHPFQFDASEDGAGFKAEVSGLRAGTQYYVRSYYVTASGDVNFSLEKTFTTKGTKISLITITAEPFEAYLDYEDGYYIDSSGNKFKYAFAWKLTLTLAPDLDDSEIEEVGFERNGNYYPLRNDPPYAGTSLVYKGLVYSESGEVKMDLRGRISFKDGHYSYSDVYKFVLKAAE